MKKTKVFIILFLIAPFIGLAQFNDDFSDGDFTSNPTWTGNTSDYIVNPSNELQLNGNSENGGISYISTQSEAMYDASWEFFVKLELNPSSTNFCSVFLTSNNENLNDATEAYFVKIGNTDDEVSLYRKDGTNATKIIDGTDDIVDMNPVNLRVKVTRDLDGNWTLMTDNTGGNNYVTQGTVNDVTYNMSEYFGVYCKYTKTKWDLYYFDDFVVTGDPYTDTESPVLESWERISSQNIIMSFSEPLDENTALDPNNYSINNGIGNPQTVSFYQSDNSKVLLHFENIFVSPTEYILQYQNIEDLSGNVISSGAISFFYIIVEPGMVVINEIMADPSPVVSLPEEEFVEIYNNTEYPIDIEGWTYKIGNSERLLPAYTLSANEYLILCKSSNVSLFTPFGNTLGIESFPSITNGGQTISLLDEALNTIDEVTYSDTWYQDSQKEDGGWTLEKIDPQNTCSQSFNWIASNDSRGGTPGEINSVFAINNDTIAPDIINLSVSAANELTILFSEPPDSSQAVVLSNFWVSPELGNPIFAMISPENNSELVIQYSVSFTENLQYELTVQGIADYCGNIMSEKTIPFVIYNAHPYDVIICEIMADPSPVVLLPDVEYIEIYNNTIYDIDLKDWAILVGNNQKNIELGLLRSHEYLLLCNSDDLNLFDESINKLGINSFPALSNGGTDISIRSNTGNIIHTVSYSDEWYKDNFKKEGGYSLEMIDLNNPCEGYNNWTASEDIKGGTPGMENSVIDENPDEINPYPIGIQVVVPDTLIVYFNENLRQEYANDVNKFMVDEVGNPTWIQALEPSFSRIKMKFNTNFERGKVYYLNIVDTIFDCVGNMVIDDTPFRFAFADSVHTGDVIINEILFNPYPDQSDFVELYNRSNRIIDLKDLWLLSFNDNNEVKSYSQITEISRIMLPNEYCAISENIKSLKDYYIIKNPENLYQVKEIPSMPNDNGNIILSDRHQNHIDEVYYSEKQHSKLLSSKDGVSLERLNYNFASDESSSWHSAAQDAGFATPGYINSQFIDEVESESEVSIEPEVFSPDNDGIDDILNINYKLDEQAYKATMAIYSSNGNFIKFILNNQMIGTQGRLYWDGFDNGNNLCKPGIYILYVEMFNDNGKKIVKKIPFVLSVRANY